MRGIEQTVGFQDTPCLSNSLFDAWANLYRRFAIAMSGSGHQEYGDFWYPDVKAGAQGVKWIEKCVESADNGAVWVDFK